MTKEELVSLLGSWENLFLLNKISPDPEEYLPLLMEIALEGKDTSSWRAVWVADKIQDHGTTPRSAASLAGDHHRHFIAYPPRRQAASTDAHAHPL